VRANGESGPAQGYAEYRQRWVSVPFHRRRYPHAFVSSGIPAVSPNYTDKARLNSPASLLQSSLSHCQSRSPYRFDDQRQSRLSHSQARLYFTLAALLFFTISVSVSASYLFPPHGAPHLSHYSPLHALPPPSPRPPFPCNQNRSILSPLLQSEMD
jgi:hypothetical protein